MTRVILHQTRRSMHSTAVVNRALIRCAWSRVNSIPGNDHGGIRNRRECVIERRIRSLQRLVPDGESMEFDELVREAADYITCIQAQVNVMRAIVDKLSEG